MQHDIIADSLSALKNARNVGKEKVVLRPVSKLMKEVLRVMQKNGYIGTFEIVDDTKGSEFIIELTTTINDCNVIKPRHYVGKGEFIKYEKRYLPARSVGVLIVSTPSGVMSHKEAIEKGIGGSLIAYVY